MNGREKQSMLRALQSLCFALLDTSLFLDSHPNNQKALDFYRKNKEAYEALKKQYTELYGPLTMSDAAGDTWEWVNNPWPWQNETEA